MSQNLTRTKAEREELRHRIWQLRNRGMNQFQIAAEVGLSRRMVVGHMKIMELRWRRECAEGIAVHKEKVLAQNDELFREAWSAWLRSLDEKTTTSTEQSDGDTGSRRKAAIKKEQKEGNPAFLAQVSKCIETRCKILGLSTINLNLNNLSTQELIDLARHAFAGTPTPGGLPVADSY